MAASPSLSSPVPFSVGDYVVNEPPGAHNGYRCRVEAVEPNGDLLLRLADVRWSGARIRATAAYCRPADPNAYDPLYGDGGYQGS